MEKAIFIKKIWKQMGKPMNRQGEPDVSLIQAKIHMNEFVIREHLSLVDNSTPKQMGKPEISNLVAKLNISRQVIEEHLSLVAILLLQK